MRQPLLLPALRALSPIARSSIPIAFDPSLAIYELQLSAESAVATQLTQLTPLSAVTLYGAGLLTSLTPCSLSMVPLTVAYFAADNDKNKSTLLPALAFTAGLAAALAWLHWPGCAHLAALSSPGIINHQIINQPSALPRP